METGPLTLSTGPRGRPSVRLRLEGPASYSAHLTHTLSIATGGEWIILDPKAYKSTLIDDEPRRVACRYMSRMVSIGSIPCADNSEKQSSFAVLASTDFV